MKGHRRNVFRGGGGATNRSGICLSVPPRGSLKDSLIGSFFFPLLESLDLWLAVSFRFLRINNLLGPEINRKWSSSGAVIENQEEVKAVAEEEETH